MIAAALMSSQLASSSLTDCFKIAVVPIDKIVGESEHICVAGHGEIDDPPPGIPDSCFVGISPHSGGAFPQVDIGCCEDFKRHLCFQDLFRGN